MISTLQGDNRYLDTSDVKVSRSRKTDVLNNREEKRQAHLHRDCSCAIDIVHLCMTGLGRRFNTRARSEPVGWVDSSGNIQHFDGADRRFAARLLRFRQLAQIPYADGIVMKTLFIV